MFRTMLLAAMTAAAFSATGASAAIVFAIAQDGANVVVTGSGSFVTPSNIPHPFDTAAYTSAINPDRGLVLTGPPATFATGYLLPTFGNGFGSVNNYFLPNTSSGDKFGISRYAVFLPRDYISRSSLYGTATYNDQTLSSLGLDAGVYTYATADDTVIVNIGPSATTVPDAAGGLLTNSGDGQLTSYDTDIYSGLYQGTYLLDFGNVAAGASVQSQLSLFNTGAAAAFSETLGGSFAGPFSFDGFSSAGSNFSGIVGGTQGGFNSVGFDTVGQSLGLHSEYFEFYLTGDYSGLDQRFIGLFRVDLRANVVSAPVAGVPEPATWGLMIAGFGMIGAVMRRRAAVAA